MWFAPDANKSVGVHAGHLLAVSLDIRMQKGLQYGDLSDLLISFRADSHHLESEDSL